MKKYLFENVGGNQFKLSEKKADNGVLWKSAEKLATALEKTWKRKVSDVRFSYETDELLTYTVELVPSKTPTPHPTSYKDLEKTHGKSGHGDPFYNFVTSTSDEEEPTEYFLWYFRPTGVWSWSEKHTWPEHQHIIGTPKTSTPFGKYTGKKQN